MRDKDKLIGVWHDGNSWIPCSWMDDGSFTDPKNPKALDLTRNLYV